ncbi:MAG: molecular chaperone Hsp90 [Clostridiales bacterium]|nr:molecular chaperone Hsp90 [Clostridiales bacterium]
MTKEVQEYVIDKTKELLNAPSCCAELKTEAQSWLDALGTAKEAEETKKYVAELEEDIIPIDGLIAFAGSEHASSIFGEEGAKNMAEHARKIKAEGAVYCDCAACSAAAAILAKNICSERWGDVLELYSDAQTDCGGGA